jgi:hypothetical protein
LRHNYEYVQCFRLVMMYEFLHCRQSRDLRDMIRGVACRLDKTEWGGLASTYLGMAIVSRRRVGEFADFFRC